MMLEYGPDTSFHFAQESLYCHPSSSRKNRKGLRDIQADSGVDKGGTILPYFVSETFGKLETMGPFPPLGIRTPSLPRYSLPSGSQDETNLSYLTQGQNQMLSLSY